MANPRAKDTDQIARHVKFESMLARLLDDRHRGFTRKSLAEGLSITPGMVSQYTTGKARPNLDFLAKIAALLDVSLDYLVFGEVATSSERRAADATLQYVDIALSKLRVQSHADSAFVGRIATALGRVVQDVASDVAKQTHNAISGTILDDETLELERYSEETRLISTNLQYDIVEIPGAADSIQPQVGGRFLPVVIENLERGATYDFLLPTRQDRDWSRTISAFQAIISNEIGSDHLTRCRFRTTSKPVFTGYGQYKLDAVRLEREKPLLFEQIREWISPTNHIAYAIAPSGDFQADTLMDEYHLSHAMSSFDELWRSAR